MLICGYAGTELKDQHRGVHLYGEQDKDLIFMVAHAMRRCDFAFCCRPNLHNADLQQQQDAVCFQYPN